MLLSSFRTCILLLFLLAVGLGSARASELESVSAAIWSRAGASLAADAGAAAKGESADLWAAERDKSSGLEAKDDDCYGDELLGELQQTAVSWPFLACADPVGRGAPVLPSAHLPGAMEPPDVSAFHG